MQAVVQAEQTLVELQPVLLDQVVVDKDLQDLVEVLQLLIVVAAAVDVDILVVMVDLVVQV